MGFARGWLLAGLTACSSNAVEPRVHVVLTLDWEGAYLSDGLPEIVALRRDYPDAAITHFVSAGYLTKTPPVDGVVNALRSVILPQDEIATHVHVWTSLVRASGIEPRTSPSFLTGTEKVVAFPDGDVGFDTDLDVYDVAELRAILRTSRSKLEEVGFDLSRSFRAGGYLTSPKVLAAITAEGYRADSSMVDANVLGDETPAFATRLHELWPKATPRSQPSVLGSVVELPIGAVFDYGTVDAAIALVDDAVASNQRDQIVVLAFHQETAGEFLPRVRELLARITRDHKGTVDFLTIEKAASLVGTGP